MILCEYIMFFFCFLHEPTGLKAIEASDPAMIIQLSFKKKTLLNYIMRTYMQLMSLSNSTALMRQITRTSEMRCICSLQYVNEGVLGECV